MSSGAMDEQAKHLLLTGIGHLRHLVETIESAPRIEVLLDPTGPRRAEDIRRQMFGEMSELGITDRDIAIELIGEIIEKQIASRTELHPRDHLRVVQAIRDWKIIESYTPARPA